MSTDRRRPPAHDGDAGPVERRLLCALELDERLLVVEYRPQLRVLRRRQIALRLHDEEARRGPDLELGLLGFELLLGQLARRDRGLDPFLDAAQLQRRVRHFRSHLQLDLPQLGVGLLQLEASPGVGGLRGAPADRIVELQLDRPGRKVRVEKLIDGVRVAARNDGRHAAAQAGAVESGTALTLELIRADQVEAGERVVAERPHVDVVDVPLPPRPRDVRPLAQSDANRGLDVDRGVADRRLIDRVERGRPELVARAVHDQALEVDFRRLPVLLRLGERLAPRRRLRLGLDDVDRGERADLDARPVVADELLGELQRLPLDRHRLHGVDELPVGVADAGQRVGDRLAEVDVGDRAVDPRDRELLARLVDAEPAQQRLRVVGGDGAPIARVEAREEVGRLPPRVVPRDVEGPAAPRHRLRHGRVEQRRVGQDVPAAVELRCRRGGARRRAEVARQRGAVEGQLLGEVEIEHLRNEALDRDVEVAVEGRATASSTVRSKRLASGVACPRRSDACSISSRTRSSAVCAWTRPDPPTPGHPNSNAPNRKPVTFSSLTDIILLAAAMTGCCAMPRPRSLPADEARGLAPGDRRRSAPLRSSGSD